MRRIVLGILGVVLVASAASAQSVDEVGYVQGFGGLTFGTAKSGGVFGGEVGINIIENVQIYGTVGQFTNVTPQAVQDALDDIYEPQCEIIFEANCEAEATSRMTFVTFGGKYLFDTGGNVRPYVAAGVGFARIKLKIEEIDFGDITDEFVDDDSDTSGLFEVGGGITVPVGGNMQVDAGYRLLKIFEDDSDLVSRVYGGFGIRF